MSRSDPKGYYRILGVLPAASAAEIKAAFRRRAMELHPDRNASLSATTEFQRLNEAYAVLSEPLARAKYDTSELQVENRQSTVQRERPEPISCSECGKVTAQPRYAIYYEIKSFILITTRTPLQGIFCSACAEKKALRATFVTWLLGWWGIPWGPIYSLHAIFMNLCGGKRPHAANARLAAYQAWAFAACGHPDLGAAIARDAIDLAKKAAPNQTVAKVRNAMGSAADGEIQQIRKQAESLLAAVGADLVGSRLKDSWAMLRRPFFVQGVVVLLALGLVTGANLSDSPWSPPSNEKPFVTKAPPAARSAKPSYVRPAAAPNGEPWPLVAGYVRGYEKLNANGLSTVTVDNSRNDSDVFAKLVTLDDRQPHPVRTFFIPAFSKQTLEKVIEGQYDVRYRDLSTGMLSRSEPFALEETKMAEGTQYSAMTMTLFKVKNGNMRTYPLSEAEF